MSTVRSDFFNTLVNQAYDDIFFETSNYYFFLGKIDPWNKEDEPDFDSFDRTSAYDRQIRDNIIYMSRIRPTNASIVTRRIKWESGKVFDYWDHTLNMEDSEFYCVTSNRDVFKCLYNGNGSESTVEPTIRSTYPFKTSDGYLWKYMYTIPPIKATKFLYGYNMPVQKALTDTFYNNGGIENVKILQSGTGYTTNQLTTIDISDSTTGSGGSVEISSVDSNGKIESVTVSNSGSGYTSGARIRITSGSGIGAILEPVISSGSITTVDIIDSGAGYNITDTVNVEVGGAEIIPTVSQVDGSIIDARIVNSGIGYSSDPTLTVLPTTVGTGIYGNSSAVLKAHVYEGSIVNLTIEDPGKDYQIDSETTITVSGDGAGASFVPVVDPSTGEIIKVVVDSSGSGYTYAVLSVDGQGTGANIEAIIGGSDLSGYQSIIEQTAVEGAVYSIKVTNPGTGYSDSTQITIEGDGTEAKAEPIVSGGQIQEIIMTDYGSGYSYTNVIIDDPTRDYLGTTVIDAEAYAILPPIGGHGFNAVKELFGRTLGIYSVIRYDNVLNLIGQDYRQYGIIRNPRTLSGNRKLTQSSVTTDFELKFNTTVNLQLDEILINNNVKYRVVNINGTNVRLQQVSSVYKVPSSVFFKQSDPGQEYTLLNVIFSPSVNKYSGDLFYTTNRGLFEPSDDQSFTVRSFLEFKTA